MLASILHSYNLDCKCHDFLKQRCSIAASAVYVSIADLLAFPLACLVFYGAVPSPRVLFAGHHLHPPTLSSS